MKYYPYSHSKLSCHEDCGFAFLQKYVNKVKVPPGEQKYFEKGNFFHHALEFYPKPPPKPFKFEHNPVKVQKEYLEYLKVFIKHEHTQYLLKDCDSKSELEFKISGNIEEYKADFSISKWKSLIYGYIDKFVLHDEFGVVTIVDWKSQHKIKDGYEPDERQMFLYAAWVFLAFEKVHTVHCEYGFVQNNEYWKKTYTRDEHAEELINGVINRITNVENDVEFAKRRSDSCKWCDYYDICQPHKVEVKRK